MDTERLSELLARVRSGEIDITEALTRLQALPYQDLGFAKVDHHRALRKGFPEVVFGQGKTPEQIAAIAREILTRSDKLLVTRATADAFAVVKAALPDAVYHPQANVITLDRAPASARRRGVIVLSAGTSDIPVAEEAAITCELMGNEVEKAYDVGVAGVHRLLDRVPQLQQARVLVVVAGMEGALPSVVAGLVRVPVIGVPTSVGYGASFGGITALLAMLNSCAPGTSVVNIDNGFGAGYLAALINLGRE